MALFTLLVAFPTVIKRDACFSQSIVSFNMVGKPAAVKVTSLVTMNRAEAAAYADGMLNEVRMAKRLQEGSRRIIHMFGFDFDDQRGLGFIAMERAMHDLEKELTVRPPSERQRKIIWRQLVEIAMTLHNANIVIFSCFGFFILLKIG